MKTARWISLALSAIAAATLATGCETSPTDPPPPSQPQRQFPHWPELLNEFRFHWSAAPGIDETTGPAVIVRAYLESYYVASYTLNVDNVYPGFNRATPENQPREGSYLLQLVDIRPLSVPMEVTAEDAQRQFGYEVFHFLELVPVDTGYRAIVCNGSYAHFIESQTHPGKFHAVGIGDRRGEPRRGDSGVRVHRIEFTQHDPRVGPNPPAPIASPQNGPAPAPDQDVFGGWFITAASHLLWGPVDGPARLPPDELEQRCEDAMPHNKEERLAMMTGFKDEPPPHGQAEPGWPVDPN